MSQILYVQMVISFTTFVILFFVWDYSRLTGGANWRDPIGLTLVLEALAIVPNMLIAILRWFGPVTVGWLNWEIWAQATTLLFIGSIMAWRVIVFEKLTDDERRLDRTVKRWLRR